MDNTNTTTTGAGNLSAVQSFLQSVATSPAPCIHGHNFCSDRDGGQCSDELLSRLNRDNDGEPLGYRDGQKIHLRQGWTMTFCMNWDAETPYLQAFVHAPRDQDSASLNWARHEGTTSGGEEIEIPDSVMAMIDEERFDDFA